MKKVILVLMAAAVLAVVARRLEMVAWMINKPHAAQACMSNSWQVGRQMITEPTDPEAW